MKILEISKKYLKNAYNNNLLEAIAKKDGVLFTNNNLIMCFCGVGGTFEDAQERFKKYLKDNSVFNIYYDLEKKVVL